MKFKATNIFIFLLLYSISGVWSQEMNVPIKVQYPLFLKILTFDRELEKRSDKEIVIGIVYQGKYNKSVMAMKEMAEVIESSSIKEIKEMSIQYVPINLDKQNLTAVAKGSGINLLYITPLRAYELQDILKISRQNQWLTMSGVADYVEKGLSVGLTLKGKKPQILINIKASREEGANFNSQLLKLARIVR